MSFYNRLYTVYIHFSGQSFGNIIKSFFHYSLVRLPLPLLTPSKILYKSSVLIFIESLVKLSKLLSHLIQ